MAKLPGLYRRGPSGAFQLRVVIPLDLRPAYGGRTKLIEALGTADEREAARIGAARRALRLAEFEDKRRSNSPQRLAAVSPDMGQLLAERVRARILGVDERIRGSADVARLLAEGGGSAASSSPPPTRCYLRGAGSCSRWCLPGAAVSFDPFVYCPLPASRVFGALLWSAFRPTWLRSWTVPPGLLFSALSVV